MVEEYFEEKNRIYGNEPEKKLIIGDFKERLENFYDLDKWEVKFEIKI